MAGWRRCPTTEGSTRCTSDPGVGTTFHLREGSRGGEAITRFTSIDPNKKIGFDGRVSRPAELSPHVRRLGVDPRPDGRCVVTCTFDLGPLGGSEWTSPLPWGRRQLGPRDAGDRANARRGVREHRPDRSGLDFPGRRLDARRVRYRVSYLRSWRVPRRAAAQRVTWDRSRRDDRGTCAPDLRCRARTPSGKPTIQPTRTRTSSSRSISSSPNVRERGSAQKSPIRRDGSKSSSWNVQETSLPVSPASCCRSGAVFPHPPGG